MMLRVATLTLLGMLALSACSDPTRKVATFATEHGFLADTVVGTIFKHRIYRHPDDVVDVETLHIYIEGDGTPFVGRYLVAADPTPRNPLMLRLMSLDPAPSAYVGRPCYFGLNHDGPCAPIYWTLWRFSPEVVDSLVAAIASEASRRHARNIVLFGHSGGGALAVLLSSRIPAVTGVVTIGANLDINAWTSLHRYTPLSGSLNPVNLQRSNPAIRMLHLVGSDDENTPPAFVQRAAAAGPGGEIRIIDGFTHNCCWEQIWSSVVRDAP